MASVGKHCQGPLGAYGLAHTSQFPAMHLCLSRESVGVQRGAARAGALCIGGVAHAANDQKDVWQVHS